MTHIFNKIHDISCTIYSSHLPIATTVARRFIKGKKFSSKTRVYMKYEIPSEKTIAMTVMMVTNSEPVYNHMHTSTNVPPAPIIQVSCTKHLLNKVLFSPVQQTLQELKC